MPFSENIMLLSFFTTASCCQAPFLILRINRLIANSRYSINRARVRAPNSRRGQAILLLDKLSSCDLLAVITYNGTRSIDPHTPR